MHAVTGKPSWSWRSPAAPGLHATRSAVGPWQGWSLAGLAALAALVPARGVWAAGLLLLAGLLVIPGLLLLRALRVPGSAIAAFPLYVPAASVVVLFASGLLADLVGPLLGISEPLRAGPLIAGLELSCLALLLAAWRTGPEMEIPWHWPAAPAWQFLLPLALPLVAAGGAARLNNGHSGAAALAAVALCCVAIVGALMLASRLDKTVLVVVLYAVSLALTWGFSLRGDLVYGFDISAEYHAMEQTITAGIWHTSHVKDAYGAMLSVTLLPAELHAVSGISGLLVFKVLYPAVNAALPVVIFLLASRVAAKAWAFAAAAMTVAQQPFFQQMPGLARQEIAIVLFAILAFAVLDRNVPRRAQLPLVALLGLGMTVSHYSTTYFAIAMFAVALPLHFLVSWLRKMPRFSPSMAVALVVATAGAFIWYGLITRSASNVSQFLSAGEGHGLDLLAGSGSLLARYLQGGAAATISAADYARQVQLYYAAHVAYVRPLPGAASRAYELRASALRTAPVRFQAGVSALSRAELIVEQLLNLIAAIGALWLVLSRKTSLLARQIGLLGLGALVILAGLRFSGTAAAAYNPERALLQGLVVLGAGVGWVLDRTAGSARRRGLVVLSASAAAILVLLASSTGLAGAVFGGGTDTNLSNAGWDYSEFDMSTPELAAAAWLGKEARPGQLIYADTYAELRLEAAFGGRPGILTDVTPLSINQQAWIYASRMNVTEDTGMAFFNNQSVSYTFPFGFLRANYDLVYDNGSSEVYSR